ncbi:MAG: HlyD family secretion protein [Defluviimonas sp.]|uniref:HlyD family secretion protein n=1 Tax=Albidovulum sp. TaxID=1872424 RepID=UPI002A2E4076|nr:HlyD family secretion protein [Defluviimonas sp.]
MNAMTKSAATAATPPAPAAAEPAPGRGRGRLVMLSLPVLIAVLGGAYVLSGGRYETTDNAYLHTARLSVASDLSGRLTEVAIRDNQVVHRGDPMFQVDPEPYRLALAAADAQLAAARLSVGQMKAAYDQAQAQLRIAETEAHYRRTELTRVRALADRGVSTKADLDGVERNSMAAEDAVISAEVAVKSAAAALGGDPEIATDAHPTVRAAQVARDRAAYEMSLTSVVAPADGIVYQAASFKQGGFVAAGSPLFALVETGDTWVDANFKETQITDFAPGQPVEISFDIRPGKTYRGHVAAIGAGTGSEFSVLPAQNATGNWVKVTQRVPVRIALDAGTPVDELPSGVSANVTVDTGRPNKLAQLFGSAAAQVVGTK